MYQTNSFARTCSPIFFIDPDGKDIIYVGDWTRKQMRHQRAMLKTSYGKAVYRQFKRSKTDDVYIMKTNVEMGRKAMVTSFNYGKYWKDDSYNLKNFLGITPTFEYRRPKSDSYFKTFSKMQGQEINNQDARIHLIAMNPKVFGLDEYAQAEAIIHEFISHILIPLILGKNVSAEMQHDIYGSDELGKNRPGSISDDVSKDVNRARINKDNDNYDSGSG